MVSRQMKRSGTRAAATTQRRRDILAAALECFVMDGYERTTIRDIQERAGASTGSMYYHFASKEHLATELYVEGIRATQEFRLRAIRDQHSAEGAVRGFVAAYLRWVSQNTQLANFLLNMRHAEFMVAAETRMRELNAAFEDSVRDVMGPYVARGEMRNLTVDVYRAMLTGPSEHFARQWLNGRTRASLGRVAGILADLAWAALRVPPASRQRKRRGA
jgi:AcrR family transcriptional regulator